MSTAIEAARLAPSAHNTQPWRFFIDGQSVRIGWDTASELPAGDPGFRYLYTCLGAAVESMRVSAASAGYSAEVEIFPVPRPDGAAVVSFGKSEGRRALTALAGAIPRRQTTRLPFDTTPVESGVLEALEQEASGDGCVLSLVTEQDTIHRIAGLITDATALNIADRDVYREFFSWVRLSEQDPSYDRDGLNLDVLTVSRLYEMLAPCVMPPSRMTALTRIGLHRVIAKSQGRLAEETPAFGLITVPGSPVSDLFSGGASMMRVWLRAAILGLKVHPMTAAMDHSETRGQLARLFGVPGDASMIVCFRLGNGPDAPKSPRLPVEELILHDDRHVNQAPVEPGDGEDR